MGKRGPKPGAVMGRPTTKIDWDQVARLCHIQCTEAEIASFLCIDPDTLCNRCKADNGMTFSEYRKQKKEGGVCSLRRKAWKMAEENPALMIFHLKNFGHMSDKTEVVFPSQINIKVTD